MIITSPYRDCRPVNKYELFYGRDKFIENLFKSSINPSTPENIAIIGETGHGKSSILNAISMKEVKEKYNYNPKSLLVFMDFEDYFGSIDDFYKIMYEALYTTINSSDAISEDLKNEIKPYDPREDNKKQIHYEK